MTVIIAEAGVNHNGSVERALDLVDAAAAAGADMIKFQTFDPAALVSKKTGKAPYQAKTTDADESQLAMLNALRLDLDGHRRVMQRCQEKGIAFLSTPFDLPSVTMLCDVLGQKIVKISSGELFNPVLLLDVARRDCRIFLSTGMAGLGDVEKALGALAFGFLGRQGKPGAPAFAEAWAEPAGRALVARNVTLLHCTTEYPAPFDQINLRAMDSLSTAFGLPTGLSDHSVGISVAIAAAARGAAVVEKHFTLDRGLPGPDHQASLEPAELSALVAAIRQVERALGDGVKTAQPVEIKNMAVVRKCLVTSRPVRRGEEFSQENLTVKRAPGTIPAEAYWDWLGRLAGQDYDEDEVIVP